MGSAARVGWVREMVYSGHWRLLVFIVRISIYRNLRRGLAFLLWPAPPSLSTTALLAPSPSVLNQVCYYPSLDYANEHPPSMMIV